jgi:hypothetical protein
MALETLAIGLALNVGSSLLGAIFGQPRKPITQREINKLETFDQPQSRYGEVIPRCYGKVRVQGIYAAAQVPFPWERDDYFNSSTSEWELTYIYYGNLAVVWCLKPRISSSPVVKRIYFNKQFYYSDGSIDSILGLYWGQFEGLTVNNYYGDQTAADPITDFLGEYQTAFKNTVYSALGRLRLNNSDGGLFDFRYPNLEAEIHTHSGSLYLSAVIADLLEGAGYDPSEFDVTELANVEITGFVTGVESLAAKLEQLQFCYFFEIVDTGAKLKFIKSFRSSSSAYLPLTVLGGTDGEKAGELFTESEVELSSLPTSFRLVYNNYNDDYQQASKESFQIKLGEWENVEEVQTTLTLSESDSLTIVNRQLLLAWARRKQYKFSLLPRFQYLEAGDVVDLILRDDTATQVQITRINQSASGLLTVEAVGYDGSIFGLGYTAPADNQTTATITQGDPIPLGQADIYAVNSVTNADGTVTYTEGDDYTVDTATGTVTPVEGGDIPEGSEVIIYWQGEPQDPPPPAAPIDTTLAAIDIVKPTDSDAPGIYVFADGDSPWQSATLWISNDGTNYVSGGTIYRGFFGTCGSILPDGSGIDNLSTLSVVLTETMSLPASGRVLVGNEILDYSSAVLAASTSTSRTYTLSQFNRALRNTDGTGHVANEDFYLLSGYKYVSAISEADIGTTRYFKAVTPGQELADVTAISILIEGNSLKGFQITHFSPTQGEIGTAISIYGSGFTGATSAAVNGTNITSFVVVSDTEITGIVATGTTTGKVSVTVGSNTAYSVADFVVTVLAVEWGDIGGNAGDNPTLEYELLKLFWVQL